MDFHGYPNWQRFGNSQAKIGQRPGKGYPVDLDPNKRIENVCADA